jgi:hypothetical protein
MNDERCIYQVAVKNGPSHGKGKKKNIAAG